MKRKKNEMKWYDVNGAVKMNSNNQTDGKFEENINYLKGKTEYISR